MSSANLKQLTAAIQSQGVHLNHQAKQMASLQQGFDRNGGKTGRFERFTLKFYPQHSPVTEAKLHSWSCTSLNRWKCGQQPSGPRVRLPARLSKGNPSALDKPTSSDWERARELCTIRQGRESVNDYAIHFCMMATDCGWNTVALMEIFLKGHPQQIFSYLWTFPVTYTLSLPWWWELMDSKIAITNLHYWPSTALPATLSPTALSFANKDPNHLCSTEFPLRKLTTNTTQGRSQNVGGASSTQEQTRTRIQDLRLRTEPLSWPLEAKALNFPLPGHPPDRHHKSLTFHVFQSGISCTKSCETAEFMNAHVTSATEGADSDSSGVLDWYQDLKVVFNKAKMTSLSPYLPYDCPIELNPGSHSQGENLCYL